MLQKRLAEITNPLQYIIACSRDAEGGILPAGMKVYHGGERIEICNTNLSDAPKELVKNILALKELAGTFIHSWKYKDEATAEDAGLVKNKKGYAQGVCCGITGGQKQSRIEYMITMPEMFTVAKRQDRNDIICFYGDCRNLEECTHIAMHLCQMGTSAAKEEFVFLTPVPESWVSQV